MYKNILIFILVFFLYGNLKAQKSVKIIDLKTVDYKKLKIDSAFLYSKIDSIADFGILQKAFPCCRVLAAKNGQIFFDKSYGYHTYDSINVLKSDDIFDLASVTKITGPLPAIMKLCDEGKIDLDAKFSSYWKPFKRTDKKDITLREILAHQAGFYPWIPFWKLTLDKNKKFKHKYISTKYSKCYSYRISDSLFIRKKFQKKIYKTIKKSRLKEKKYKYSGLIFYLFPELISKISKQDYQKYLKDNFYSPIDALTLGYNPLEKFSKERIVPTENDKFFRKTQLQGYVHDEGAAVMGGVSGNAGLFGTAYDLAKIMQMYLNYGNYNNKQLIKEKTVKEFIKIQYPENNNRRALCFDKPLLENRKNGSCAVSASQESFGHSGYTGTFVWADPENNMIFIFLSNRVYPTRSNPKIYKLNIRPSIHQVLYDCFE